MRRAGRTRLRREFPFGQRSTCLCRLGGYVSLTRVLVVLCRRPSDESSPLATLAGYANALFTALTPAENRVEDMTRASPSSPSSPRTSCTPRRTSMGGGRGGAGNIGCASCPPEDARTTRAGSLASSNRFLPRTASSRAENQYSAYSSASCAAAQQGYDPERPPASSSRGVGSSSSPWA